MSRPPPFSWPKNCSSPVSNLSVQRRAFEQPVFRLPLPHRCAAFRTFRQSAEALPPESPLISAGPFFRIRLPAKRVRLQKPAPVQPRFRLPALFEIPMERILILGVGNILFTDEGIGVRSLEWLQEHYAFPENVTLVDGGTLGIGLMDALLQCDRVYVLDAVLGGGEPGSIYRLTDNDLRKSMSFRDSLHQTDLVDTLIYCDILGHRPEGVVFGMEPFDYNTMELGLSPVCAEAVPALARKLVDELRELGMDISER